MAENERFRNARSGGDFLGGGAFEAFTGKEIESGFEKLIAGR
jgi:hypothetical protein